MIVVAAFVAGVVAVVLAITSDHQDDNGGGEDGTVGPFRAGNPMSPSSRRHRSNPANTRPRDEAPLGR
jgi:hypothetical protein